MKKEWHDKIEAYLKGRLSEEEAAAFQAAVSEDHRLARELEHFRFQEEAMELLIAAKAQEKAKAWIPELAGLPTPLSETGRPSGFRNWLWLGGLAIALGLIFFLILRPESSGENSDTASSNTGPVAKVTEPSPPKEKAETPIAPPEITSTEDSPVDTPPSPPPSNITAEKQQDYFALADRKKEHKTILATTLGDAPQSGQAAVDGLEAYEDKEYSRAIEILRSVQAGEEGYDRSQEALAHAYFHTGQYDKAVGAFRNLIGKSASRRLRQDYEWRLLLSYFGNYPEYREAFDALADQIIEQTPRYKSRAEGLKAAAENLPQ